MDSVTSSLYGIGTSAVSMHSSCQNDISGHFNYVPYSYQGMYYMNHICAHCLNVSYAKRSYSFFNDVLSYCRDRPLLYECMLYVIM
jgi:hypothetical protein